MNSLTLLFLILLGGLAACNPGQEKKTALSQDSVSEEALGLTTAVPKITRIGIGCDAGDCIWMNVENFVANRTCFKVLKGTDKSTLLGNYCPSIPQFRLTKAQHDELKRSGLWMQALNGAQASKKVFIKAGDAAFYPFACACQASKANFCHYAIGTANCHMVQRGGYCDPNKNGQTDDADWVRGYNEYQEYCKSGPAPTPTPRPTPTPSPTPTPTTTCEVNSVATLKSCVANIQRYNILDFKNNVTCSNDSECCSGSAALMNLNNKSNLTIKGNNKLITRMRGQRNCSILTAFNSKNIRIENLSFDENASVGACEEYHNCPYGLDFVNAQNIVLYNTKLIHAKACAIHVWAVDGFTFENSSLMYSGVLGLYVGHARYGMTKRLIIKNSYFFNNATNAIAIQGVTGSTMTDNLITGNTLIGNHRWGRWPVPPQYGPVMGPGGQLLIDMGDHLTVNNNQISDGFCVNCLDQNKAFNNSVNTAIAGIELVMPDSTDIGFRYLNITNNRIYNNDGQAINLNEGSYLDNTTTITNNTAYNNGAPFVLRGSVVQSGNWILPIKMFNSFEGSTDFSSSWGNWNACNPESNAFRWCPGAPEAHYQNCVVRMYTKNRNCSIDHAGMYSQGMRLNIGASKHVMASLMVRNGGSRAQACIVYLQGSNQEISRTCKDIPADKGWIYHGVNIEGQTPSGTTYIQTRVVLLSDNGYLDFDNVRVTTN